MTMPPLSELALPGDVVQVDPAELDYGGALLLVQATTERGVRGSYVVPTERGPRTQYAPYVRHGSYAVVGKARWLPPG